MVSVAGLLFQKFEVFARVVCHRAQLLFYPYQLVVFGNTVGTRCRAGFYLATVKGYRQVGNGNIFAFAATVAHYRGVRVAVRQV